MQFLSPLTPCSESFQLSSADWTVALVLTALVIRRNTNQKWLISKSDVGRRMPSPPLKLPLFMRRDGPPTNMWLLRRTCRVHYLNVFHVTLGFVPRRPVMFLNRNKWFSLTKC